MATTNTMAKKQAVSAGLSLLEQRRRAQILKNIVSYIILGLFSIIFVVPLLYTLATSFKYKGDVFDGRFIPKPAIEPLLWNYFGRNSNLQGRPTPVTENAKMLINALQAETPNETYITNILATKKLPDISLVKELKQELSVQFLKNPVERDFTRARSLAYNDPTTTNNISYILKSITYDGAWYAGWSGNGLPPFAQAYINSLFVSIVITLIQLVTCALAAYAFARLHWPGRDKVFIGYLGTMMVPGQVTMIPVFILFKNLGIIDTYAALILPASFSAYGTFMLRQYFLSIPAALEEAAVIDGATKMQILIQIIMPLSKTALSTLAIFTFIYAWNDFMWPLIVINSDSKKTLPIMLQSFQTSYGAQWHLIMAASMIVLIPVVIVFIFGQKYITRGIMMTGIK